MSFGLCNMRHLCLRSARSHRRCDRTFLDLAVWQLPILWRSPSRGRTDQTRAPTGRRFSFQNFLPDSCSSYLSRWYSACAGAAYRNNPRMKAARRAWRRRAWINMTKATLWAAVFVYVAYLVLSWNESTDSFSAIPHFPPSPAFRRLLMPVWLYLRGLILFAVSAGSRPTYILGHSYSHGVWFYFPTLFVLKSPLAFLLLLLIADTVAIFLKRISTGKPSAIPGGMGLELASCVGFLVVFLTAAILNRLDISIRHLTIVLALLTLLLAPLPRMLQSMRSSNLRYLSAGDWITVGLAAASLAMAVWAYPNYFPF